MDKVFRITLTAAAIGIAALSFTAPAQAGNGSAVGAGLVGFGIGAILGSMMGPPEVYFVPPPPDYDGPVVYGPPNYDGPVAYGPPHSYRAPPAPTGPAATGRLSRTGPAAMERRHRRPIAMAIGPIHVPRRRRLPQLDERRPAPTRSATAKTGPVTAPVKQDAGCQVQGRASKGKARRGPACSPKRTSRV